DQCRFLVKRITPAACVAALRCRFTAQAKTSTNTPLASAENRFFITTLTSASFSHITGFVVLAVISRQNGGQCGMCW
ncbi:hypothetical protein, partial [Escherichia coli]|uniref:hypothetical protein n=1 Tax=Escherichia coli TaxID=562 RepID=UPI002FCCEC85